MNQFNERLLGLSSTQRALRYSQLARACMRHYDLGDMSATFIRHNGGITYRLDDQEGQPSFLLKIAQPAGESGSVPPERIACVMDWLVALDLDGRVAVQAPVANRRGGFVTAVELADLDDPLHATVQRWIPGRHVRSPYTADLCYQVGEMVGRLHKHSSRWTVGHASKGLVQDDRWLLHRLRILHKVVDLDILSPEEWRTVERAVTRIVEVMQALTTRSDGWGAIHGDLHQDNLLFHHEGAQPIDFGDFRLAHFAYDLGVILYHLMYLEDAGVRRAVLDGYASIRPLPRGVPLWPEAFVCAAALSNLSFQATIPDQLASDRTALNVREFATLHCASLVSSECFVCVP